mgnify:CR=1 FL=1
MAKVKNIFNIEFEEEDIQNMQSLDGVFALLYYLYYMILIFCFGLIMFNTDIYVNWGNNFINGSMYRFIFYVPITILSILPIIFIIQFRKQSISSLGIRKANVVKSIFLGILFSLPFLIPNIKNGIIYNYEFKNVEFLIWDFLYFLISIALVEEIIFRGFIQIRIRGIIKDKWLSILIVGIMCSIMHIPFQMMNSNLSLVEFIDMTYLIKLVIMHIYFVYIYTRDNNIIAPIVAHTIINFSKYLFI